jgi:hypothetical protein
LLIHTPVSGSAWNADDHDAKSGVGRSSVSDDAPFEPCRPRVSIFGNLVFGGVNGTVKRPSLCGALWAACLDEFGLQIRHRRCALDVQVRRIFLSLVWLETAGLSKQITDFWAWRRGGPLIDSGWTFGLSVIRQQRSSPAGVGCLPIRKSCYGCCVGCLLQAQRAQSVELDHRRMLTSVRCGDEASHRSVRGVRALPNMRRTVPLQPPEPLPLQSEQSPHAVVAWRPGRRRDIQLRTSSQIKSTSPPCLKSPLHHIPPLYPFSTKAFQFPEADTSCFCSKSPAQPSCPGVGFAVSSSSSPPTSLETRLSFQTTSGFTIHFPQLPCTTIDAMRS